MTGQDNIIELRGVDKSFEDTRALEGIDLSISNGEFLTPVSYTHLTLPTIA